MSASTSAIFEELLGALRELESRQSAESQIQACEKASVYLQNALARKRPEYNFALFQRAVSDWLPWDEPFLSVVNSCARRLSKHA
jgi:hypothetical protein